MSRYGYKKEQRKNTKKAVRFIALSACILGLTIAFYAFFPLISWNIYFMPVFAAHSVTTPIPTSTIITKSSLPDLLSEAVDSFQRKSLDAKSWFPNIPLINEAYPAKTYSLSIPILNIKNAEVSTSDYDLSKHLVHYGGTAFPPKTGNAVIFGHSTLPQLFNPKDYKTIFANVYKMNLGDDISLKILGVEYFYKVNSIRVVDSTDTSIFEQNYDNSYITLVTCTPPGTTWKRLLVTARIQPLQ